MTAPVTEIHDENTLRGGIRPLVFPRSLAIVGASERNLRPIEGAHAGGRDVVLVNPNRTEIAGRPCVPSIAAAPFVPELALLLVSHARVVDALRDGLAAGVRSFIVPGVGAEAGADGPGLIAELGALAREAGAAFVGPNCMGVACPGGPSTWIGTVPDTFLPGHVAVVVQSGSVGDAFIACGPRIGFRCVVSSGGEVEPRRGRPPRLPRGGRRHPRHRALPRDGAPARRVHRGTRAGCRERRSPSSASRSGARRPRRARRWPTRVRWSARPGPSRPSSAATERSRWTTCTTCSRRSKSSAAAAARRADGLRQCPSRAGNVRSSPTRVRPLGLPFEPLPEGVAATLRAEFPNFVAPGNPLDAWAIADETVVYPRSLSLLAKSGAYDILLAQVDLSRFRGASEEVWCEMIVRSLADAVEGTGVVPAVTSVHATDPPDRIATLARDRDLPLLRGTEHGLRALAAVARWKPRPRAEIGDPVDLSGLSAGRPAARARVCPRPRALRHRLRPAPAGGEPRGGRPGSRRDRLPGRRQGRRARAQGGRRWCRSRDRDAGGGRRGRGATGRSGSRCPAAAGRDRGALRDGPRPRVRPRRRRRSRRERRSRRCRSPPCASRRSTWSSRASSCGMRPASRQSPRTRRWTRSPASWSHSDGWRPSIPRSLPCDINPLILSADGATAVDALVVVDRGAPHE